MAVYGGKGYYPLEAAQPDVIGKVGGMYQVVPETEPQIQQYLHQYQNPVAGQSNKGNIRASVEYQPQ
ncbi:MAG: hypothetical protein ACOX7W_06110 [Christensenellales bacterium]|jgi:hypothetical protein